jgi:hypothetical protein
MRSQERLRHPCLLSHPFRVPFGGGATDPGLTSGATDSGLFEAQGIKHQDTNN